MREDWVEVELGKVFYTATGNTPPKKEKLNYGSEIPFVKPPEFKDKPKLCGKASLKKPLATLKARGKK